MRKTSFLQDRDMIRAGLVTAISGFSTLMLMATVVQADEVTPPADSEMRYELSDPTDTPPVNYRSGVDESFDTPSTHDAEMYAEEYERQRNEDKVRAREQLDRINNFSSGAVTRDGVVPDRSGF